MIQKFKVFVILLAAIPSGFSNLQTFAQTKINKAFQPKPNSTEKSSATADFNNTPQWYVYYTVNIEGDGGEVITDGETKVWKVKRIYTGELLLDKRQQAPQIPASVLNLPNIPGEAREKIKEGLGQLSKPGSIEWHAYPLYYKEINHRALTTIDDEIEQVTLITGSAGSWTKRRITETWNGKGLSQGSASAAFYPDLSNLSFRVNLPLFAGCVEQLITYTKAVETTYSLLGHGTPKPDPPPATKKYSCNAFINPVIKGVIQSGVTIKAPPGSLNLNVESWSYVLPVLQAENSLLDGFDTKGNVTVKIGLKFSKKKIE